MILKVSTSRMFSWNWECYTMLKMHWLKIQTNILMTANRMSIVFQKMRVLHRIFQNIDTERKTMKPLKWLKWPKFVTIITCMDTLKPANAQMLSHQTMDTQLLIKQDSTKCANRHKNSHYAGNFLLSSLNQFIWMNWWFFNYLNWHLLFTDISVTSHGRSFHILT